MSQIPSNNQEIVSVSDINNLAKGLLEKDLSNVWIQGEISSFTAHGSGHWYFTIKDKKSSLSCVMFKFENQNVLFDPKVGDELILNGNISIYAPSGRYQFNVKHIEVFGEGALLKAFEDLKFKLESEGLFNQNIKKEIPYLPLSVAVITSETGAVFRDIINVLRRRSPFIKLTLIESKVQGKTADKDIVQAIKRANEIKDFDLIILARGGGSIEDLWCFNMESVAREISNSQLPIISAVGHETDFTISDFVADLRAPTPSAAAEIISQNHSNLLESFSRNKIHIENRFLSLLSQLKEGLDLKIALLRHPGEKLRETSQKIDNFETHIVPIIADIDAGFGNEEATYLMAKQMIEAGACAIQIENQVSDEKQCGHQDGKVTVPHAEFLAKINAVRYAFLELGVEDGVIVARTDSLGAGLTARIAITKEVGDLGDQYNSFLDTEEVNETDIKHGDVMINHHGKIVRPKRLPSNLYKFKEGTGEARCILDSITSLQSGADLIWIETEKPHIGQIAEMMNEIKKVVPNAKLVYNNSPSFNWTLNFRQQVFDTWESKGKDLTQYKRNELMDEKYDSTELAKEADEKIRTFQADAANEAGIFHHLITLPTYHTAALSTDNLAKAYFGDDGMLGYVKNVQRQEIRQGIACVKHQNMAGSDMGDDHKEYFAGEAALKAAGKDNTMNQF